MITCKHEQDSADKGQVLPPTLTLADETYDGSNEENEKASKREPC